MINQRNRIGFDSKFLNDLINEPIKEQNCSVCFPTEFSRRYYNKTPLLSIICWLTICFEPTVISINFKTSWINHLFSSVSIHIKIPLNVQANKNWCFVFVLFRRNVKKLWSVCICVGLKVKVRGELIYEMIISCIENSREF